MPLNRRTFLRQSALTAAGSSLLSAVPMELLAAYRKPVAAADTINAALIGCRGMGWADLTSMLKMPQVRCAALCDVDQNVLGKRMADLEKINIKPDTYGDYRKLLERKDVDVVIIATPDHWHCLQMTDAVAAGKDVYVEKPAANSIAEAQLMVAAAKRSGRMVQVNQWQRSQQHFKDAIGYVQSGKLGQITMAKTWIYSAGAVALNPVPDEAVPAGVDYNMWLGPAPRRPFNKYRFHNDFRWFYDYAGGTMTDWGVHLIDIVLEAMKVDMPQSVVSAGGKQMFPGDARETPDTQLATYDYGSFLMTWEHGMGLGSAPFGLDHGIAFFGANGTMFLNRNGWEVKPAMVNKEPKIPVVAWQPTQENGLDAHTRNFIEVVGSRAYNKLNCPIEAGSRVAINSHMGNIAQRTGEKIFWDAGDNNFSTAKANKLITPEYHNGWKLPRRVS